MNKYYNRSFHNNSNSSLNLLIMSGLLVYIKLSKLLQNAVCVKFNDPKTNFASLGFFSSIKQNL